MLNSQLHSTDQMDRVNEVLRIGGPEFITRANHDDEIRDDQTP